MNAPNFNNSTYKEYLDGWRGLAILCVLYAHFLPIGNTKWLGSFGVDLFFVLSGYLMANVLFIKKQTLRKFFIRRFSRVFPVFALYILVALIVSKLGHGSVHSVNFEELLSTLLFLRSYFPSNPSIWAADWSIGHIWSLNIEEHSYIALAIIAFALRDKGGNTLLIVLLASILLMFLFRNFHKQGIWPSPSDFTLYSHVAAYAIFTSVFCRVFTDGGYDYFIKQHVRGSISVAAFICAVVVSSPQVGKPFFAPIFLAISISYFSFIPSIIKKLFSNKIICVFGHASFSLYLWQQLYHENVDDKITGLVFAVLTGFLCYTFLENPIRKYLNARYAK